MAASNVKTEKSAFPVWKILYKNLFLIILITIIGVAGGFIVGKLRAKPTYTARCSVILTTSLDPSSLSAGSATTDLSLAKITLPSVISLIKAPETVNEANSLYNGSGKIYASSIGTQSSESCIFTITYTDSDAETAKEKLESVVDGTRSIIARYEAEGKKIISAGEVGFTPTQAEPNVVYSYSIGKYVIVGLAIGLIVSIVSVIAVFLLDNKVKDAKDLEELTDTSVIAYIE